MHTLGGDRMNLMLILFLQSSIFVAGFLAGYVVHSWRLHRRQARFVTIVPRNSRSQLSTFGHARRAF
jgi:hypothetical protein